MIDPRTEELLNAALDGALTDGEAEELRNRLAQSDEARAYQASLEALHNALGSLPQQDLPGALHGSISDGIQLPSSSPRSAVFPISAWPGVIRYGLAASLGMAVAIFLYQIQPDLGTAVDYSQMTGHDCTR